MTAVMEAPRTVGSPVLWGRPASPSPDPAFARMLLDFLRDFNSVGKTVLMSRGGRLRIVVHADTGSVYPEPEPVASEPEPPLLRIPPFVASLAEG